MKNRKVLIIIFSIVLVISAIIFGIHKFYSSYMFNEDGTISGSINDFHKLYYEQLEKVSGDDRINLINFGVEQNIITREEAEELFKSE